MRQAAPAAAEKARGTASAAVQAAEEQATPSHDVYGHLPKPEENDKVCSLRCTCKSHSVNRMTRSAHYPTNAKP